MSFNDASYIKGVERSLDTLPPQARIAFAVWCTENLFSQEVRDFLAAKIGTAQYSAVEQALDYLWKCASSYEIDGDKVSRLAEACATIGWDDAAIADDEQDPQIYAIEAAGALCNALDVCKTGSALVAAECAQCVLNKLDWELRVEFFLGSEDVTSYPKWKAELERQQRMLEFLQDSPGLKPDQRRLFRE